MRSGRSLTTVLATVLAAVALVAAACSDGTSSAGGSAGTTAAPATSTGAASRRAYGVGTVQRTFVDRSRPTAANNGVAGKADRTLVTTVYYPAGSAPSASVPPATTADATPASSGGPFPLVVFSHGLGANEAIYAPLLASWAAAGYVVAAPHFPLTYAGTPGGVNGGDVQNQPGDLRFVIDQVLAEAAVPGSPLRGLVRADAIGLAGHSNGAITTLGAVAHTCCREPRAKAAVVLAGITSPFGNGRYDLADTPPLLFVHGVDDALVAYNQAVADVNAVRAPKGMLTLDKGDHGNWLVPANDAFGVVVAATLDFLDGYLRDDGAARGRLPGDGRSGVATMRWSPDAAGSVPVPTLPQAATNRKVEVTPTTGLRDGQKVTVTWSGFLPGKTVNIVQCAGDGTRGSGACDITTGRILQPDPTGAGTLDLTVRVGAVGDGVCDPANPCTIVVNDAGLQDADATLRFPVTFAA